MTGKLDPLFSNPCLRSKFFSKFYVGIAAWLELVITFISSIVGGREALDGTWPFAVALGRPNTTTFTPVCGGTLISDQYVLTAGHCLPDNPEPDQVVSVHLFQASLKLSMT